MATYNVSNTSALNNALRNADGGDTIVLGSGNYSIDARGIGGGSDITIRGSGNATITEFDLNASRNIEIENVTFRQAGARIHNSENIDLRNVEIIGTSGGYGDGTGLKITGSEGVTLQGSQLVSLEHGIVLQTSEDITISGNRLSNISYDGISANQVDDLRITGNTIDMNTRDNVKHKDGIQIANQGSSGPSTNVTISNNRIDTNDSSTHGIYLGNNDAKSSGRTSEFYRDVDITGNDITAGHKLGIAVGETIGLTITGNDLSRATGSTKAINTPLILVDDNSQNVRVSGNSGYGDPAPASNNWQVSGSASRWGGNSGSSNNSSRNNDDDTGAPIASNGPSDAASGGSSGGSSGSNGRADRFKISEGDGGTISVDFDEGDRIVFRNFDNGTFEDVSGGNVVSNNRAGNWVRVDSVTDLQELVHASDDVRASTSGDTLTFWADGTRVEIEGVGRDYSSGFDADLF